MIKKQKRIISYLMVFVLTFSSVNCCYICTSDLKVYAESTHLQRMRDLAVTALSALGYAITGNPSKTIDNIVTIFRNGNLLAEYNEEGGTEDGGGYAKVSINSNGKWTIDEPIVQAVKSYMKSNYDDVYGYYTVNCNNSGSIPASMFPTYADYLKVKAVMSEWGNVEIYRNGTYTRISKVRIGENGHYYQGDAFSGTCYHVNVTYPIAHTTVGVSGGKYIDKTGNASDTLSPYINTRDSQQDIVSSYCYTKSGQLTIFKNRESALDYYSGTSVYYKGKSSYTSGSMTSTPVTETQYNNISSAVSSAIGNLVNTGELPSVDDITRIINESLSALLQEQVAELQGVNVNLKETNSWLAKIYSLLGISNTTGANINNKLDSIITAINNASSNIVRAIGNNTGSSVTVDTASIVSMLQQIKNDIANNNDEINDNVLKIYKQCSEILTELQNTKDDTITLDTSKLEKLLEEILANSKENTTGNVTINTDAIEGLLKDIKGVDTDIYNKLVDVDEGVLTDLLNSIQDYQSAAKGYFRDSLESSENIEKSLDRIEKLLLANTLLELGDNEEENKSLVDKMLAPVVAECTKTATTLKTKLPFSLPWDIYSLVMIMVAKPVAPKFEIPIHFESINYDDKVVIDLSKAEILSKLCRSMLSLIFAMYLIQLTRKFLKNQGD